jgi:hypothetical protein
MHSGIRHKIASPHAKALRQIIFARDRPLPQADELFTRKGRRLKQR